jgi:uncharacterized protein YxeA
MKTIITKLSAIVLAITITLTAVSCHRGPSTTIYTGDGDNYKKIEYRGRVEFNQQQTSIVDIANGGYLRYEQNGKSFEAEPGSNGRILYSFNGESQVNSLSQDQKNFVAEGIKEIIKQRSKQKNQ